MKLLTRSSYILVTTVLFTFFIGSIFFYILLKSATEKEIREELMTQYHMVLKEIRKQPGESGRISIPGFLFVETDHSLQQPKVMLRDTLLVDSFTGTYQQYKVLQAEQQLDGIWYRIIVYKSLVESDALIEKIILVVTIIILLFIGILYFLNRFMFSRAWKDFFDTLDKLREYNFDTGKEMHFIRSEITEFDILNTTLNHMSAKIQRDYDEIREFTGNISHEIQTPLTIIKQKAELLMQTPSISREQATLLGDIQKTVSRLSRLNNTLILQTKIESRQFTRKEQIDLKKVVEQHMEEFTPFMDELELKRDVNLHETKIVRADPMLMDVLIVNLIKNAVNHNIPGGKINVSLQNGEFSISNTGSHKDLSDIGIFDRYTRFNKQKSSLGLGLSLVKKICDLYSFSVRYFYKDDLHHFTLRFS